MAGKESIYNSTAEQIMQEFQTGSEGLTQEEAAERLKQYGPNNLPKRKGKTLLGVFLHQFLSPLIYVLVGAGILSIIIGEGGDSIFIFAIIFINAVLGTWQEWAAEKNAVALQSMIHIRSRVKRGGRMYEVDSEELVPGDIVLLESGIKVPADLRLFDVNGLLIEEALLTGESEAVEKTTKPIDEKNAALGDQTNMAFAATTVMKGRGWGIVTATALKTELGRIAESLTESEAERPPLIRRMDAFARRISVVVVIACIVLALIGWYRGMPMMEILFLMVAAGVAAIPEGLPIALTVALSIGTRRMAKRNVIVRRLPAVEGLGSCTLIASDKTGTLTMDQQSVKKLVLPGNKSFTVTGQGYNGEGEIADENEEKVSKDDEALIELIRAAVLANEGILRPVGDEWEHSGDAVDVALRALAYKFGEKPAWFAEKTKVEKMLPYESERKYSGVFFRMNDQLHFAIKGAAEVVLPRLDNNDANAYEEIAEQMAAEGYRVLALASGIAGSTDPESAGTLRLLGLVGMIDPLREEAVPAIKECHHAGIKVVMITGDHPSTAFTIADQLGITSSRGQLVTGKELQEQYERDKEALTELIAQKLVFARVSPIQKQKIIGAFKNEGEFVAVTGDGANDAPALKTAHIGISMGSGTDLAKESSSLIVTDNNFASIAAGVEEGRFTFDNLRKIIYLLISTGLAEIMLVALPLFFGMPLMFIATQLLWLNLVTNGIQDIALAFEKGDPAIMRQPPRKPDEPIFNRLMNQQILVSAFTMSVITFGAWWLMTDQWGYEESHARTLIMMLMVLQQNFHVLNCRSETRSLFSLPLRTNPIVFIGIIIAQGVHISAAYIPGLNEVLQLEPVSFNEWLTLVPAAAAIFLVMELFKLKERRKEKQKEKEKEKE